MNRMDKNPCSQGFNILMKRALSKFKEVSKYLTCHRVLSGLEKYRVGREGTREQGARGGQLNIGSSGKFSLRRWYLEPGR